MNLRGLRRAETIGISAGCAVDGNEPPEYYESVALPAELHQRRAARPWKQEPIHTRSLRHAAPSSAGYMIPQFSGRVKAEIWQAAGAAGGKTAGDGYAGQDEYYKWYFCSPSVIFHLVILPEISPRRPAGGTAGFPTVRQILTNSAARRGKGAEGDIDINFMIIFFYLELFTLSTEFSTRQNPFVSNEFLRCFPVIHVGLPPFFRCFPPCFFFT